MAVEKPFKFIDETDLTAREYRHESCSPSSLHSSDLAQHVEDNARSSEGHGSDSTYLPLASVSAAAPRHEIGEYTADTIASASPKEQETVKSTSTEGAANVFWQVLSQSQEEPHGQSSSYRLDGPTNSNDEGHAHALTPATTLSDYCSTIQLRSSINLLHHLPAQPLRDEEQAFLMQRFTHVVGQWMDASDLAGIWSRGVPHLALRHDMVKECCFACAAKQLALADVRQETTNRGEQSREYWLERGRQAYSAGIAHLLQQISTSTTQAQESAEISTEAFVATVLCSVYEMIDSPETEWQGHLEGISRIGKIKRVNGSCGGFEEAAFWCFARQEVVCCLINRREPRMNPDLWETPLGSPVEIGREDIGHRQ